MTTATITDTQIRNLRAEAAAAGDLAQVNLCDAALGLAEAWMVDEAREQCAMAIAAAADASDAGDAGDLTTIPARFDGGAGVIRVGDRRCYVEG